MKRLLLLAGCGLASLAAHAQTAPRSQAATAEQRLAEDLGVERLPPLPTDSRNINTLLQVGTSNAADINQVNQGGRANQAVLVQSGVGNTLGLAQVGSGNQTTFSQAGEANRVGLRQVGMANTIVGRVTGNDNGLDVVQQGVNNQYSTQLLGNKGRYDIEQIGNNNILTQRETATAAPLPGYEVKMQGSGMHLTIEQGKAFR